MKRATFRPRRIRLSAAPGVNHRDVRLVVVAMLLLVLISSKSLFAVVHAKGSTNGLLRPKMEDISSLKKQYIQSGVSKFASFNVYAEYLRQKGEFPFSGYMTGFENDDILDVIVDTEDVNIMPRNSRGLVSTASMDLKPINGHCVRVRFEHMEGLVDIVDHAIKNPGMVTEIRHTRLEHLLLLNSLNHHDVKEIHSQAEQRKRNLSSDSSSSKSNKNQKSNNRKKKKKKNKKKDKSSTSSSSSKRSEKTSPTASPTDDNDGPSVSPMDIPSSPPTRHPTVIPSTLPSFDPTGFPSINPSFSPTNKPSSSLTRHPSDLPSSTPSANPTTKPTTKPSAFPSYMPSGKPTLRPSGAPTILPSGKPTKTPTTKPSVVPSYMPSRNPTLPPSIAPTTLPSDEPTKPPTSLPSDNPSKTPSAKPSLYPSEKPTFLPTKFPSNPPTKHPSEHPSNFINTGDVIAEARFSHRLNEIFETYGIIGQSIRIGVLDDSVDYITELVDRGELPNDVTIESESNEPGSRGTAMLEVVYDVCPGCKLFFATSWTGMEPYANNIRQLYDKHQCQVIISNGLYFAEAYFQDDMIAQAVDYVSSKGVFFYAAAGINGNSFSGVKNTYIGDWNPGFDFNSYEYPDAHRFSNETGYLNPLKITTSDVGETIFTLHYSEPLGAVKIDLDFFILDENESIMTSSVSDNIKNGRPYEIFTYTPTSNNSLFVAQYISEGFSTSCQKLHIVAFDPLVDLEHYSDPLRNIYGSAAASSAIAVGSVTIVGNEVFDESTDIAGYSSEGLPEICFDKDGNRTVTDGSSDCIERAAPTITAGSGVSVTTPGYSPQFHGAGTSAAVAGAITAVLLEAFPDLDRNQIFDAYKETSIDILSEGFDTASGYGIVDALALFEFILDKQTTCSSYAECPAGTACTCLSDGTCYCKAELVEA